MQWEGAAARGSCHRQVIVRKYLRRLRRFHEHLFRQWHRIAGPSLPCEPFGRAVGEFLMLVQLVYYARSKDENSLPPWPAIRRQCGTDCTTNDLFKTVGELTGAKLLKTRISADRNNGAKRSADLEPWLAHGQLACEQRRLPMSALVGWICLSISACILVTTFPRLGGSVLAPSLVPVFGVFFSILYTIAQYTYTSWLRSRRGAMVVTGLFLLGMVMGGLGRAMDVSGQFEQLGMTYVRQMLSGGACLSGLGLGIGLVKGSIRPEAPHACS